MGRRAPGARVALVAHGGAPLAELDLGPPLTFVLGAEREGLPDDVLGRCDAAATIPLPGEAESLNVAAAGAIALYELSRRGALTIVGCRGLAERRRLRRRRRRHRRPEKPPPPPPEPEDGGASAEPKPEARSPIADARWRRSRGRRPGEIQ